MWRWLASQSAGRPARLLFLGLVIIAAGLFTFLGTAGVERYGAGFIIAVGAFNAAIGIAGLRERRSREGEDVIGAFRKEAKDVIGAFRKIAQPEKRSPKLLRPGDWVAILGGHVGLGAGMEKLASEGDWYGVAIGAVIYVSALPILWPILARHREARRQQREAAHAEFLAREVGRPSGEPERPGD
jgi:hypothetical protein